MGTNYYLKMPACVTCGHVPAQLHIGKSSGGWNFGLRIYSKGETSDLVAFGVEEIRELDDWRPLLTKFQIIDEYDRPVATEDMLKTITHRSHPNGLLSRAKPNVEYYDRTGRCKVGQDGTYDLCPYEFS